jgi:hypothetical protein
MFKKFCKLFFRAKFFFARPKKKNIIILDCETSTHIRYLLRDKKDVTLIKVRSEKIDNIYLNFFIISYLIRNIFKESLKINYLISLILLLEPKLIITQYDNSMEIHEISRILKNKKIKILVAQGAVRSFKGVKNITNFFLKDYLVFSDYEKKFFKENNLKVENFHSIGSIKAAAAIEYLKFNNINTKKKYDICLISELLDKINNSTDKKYMNMLVNLSSILREIRENKKNFKIIIAGSGDSESSIAKVEKNFFDKIFGKNNYDIDHSDRSAYPSYKNILRSDLTLGVHSTMLREALGMRKKICVYNYMPETEYYFMAKDFFVVDKPSKTLLKKKIEEILNIK